MIMLDALERTLPNFESSSRWKLGHGCRWERAQLKSEKSVLRKTVLTQAEFLSVLCEGHADGPSKFGGKGQSDLYE